MRTSCAGLGDKSAAPAADRTLIDGYSPARPAPLMLFEHRFPLADLQQVPADCGIAAKPFGKRKFRSLYCGMRYPHNRPSRSDCHVFLNGLIKRCCSQPAAQIACGLFVDTNGIQRFRHLVVGASQGQLRHQDLFRSEVRKIAVELLTKSLGSNQAIAVKAMPVPEARP